MHPLAKNTAYGRDGTAHDLRNRILGLIEQDLEERRSSKLFVEVRAESGSSCEKEIVALCRGTPGPTPRLERAGCGATTRSASGGEGRLHLLEPRRLYIREIRDLSPKDLPALIEADRLWAEEEFHRARAEVVRGAQVDLGRFFIAGSPK